MSLMSTNLYENFLGGVSEIGKFNPFFQLKIFNVAQREHRRCTIGVLPFLEVSLEMGVSWPRMMKPTMTEIPNLWMMEKSKC